MAPWRTTASDGKIEVWHSDYLGVPAADGAQFAELAANEPSELYQDVATTPGTLLSYAVSHRGRNGTDTMRIEFGPPSGPANFTRDVSTGNTAWHQVLGTYLVPPGQTTTRFGFEAVVDALGSPSQGNFLDGVALTQARCSIRVTRRSRRPVTRPVRSEHRRSGRRRPRSATAARAACRWGWTRSRCQSARRRARNSPGYATAIRCTDSATGELVTEAADTSATVRFDQPRDVACTVSNRGGPAVVMQEQIFPASAPGRFDLLVNGTVVAAAARDQTVAGPVAVDPAW